MHFYFQQTLAKTLQGGRSFLGRPQADLPEIPLKPREMALSGRRHIPVTDSRASLEKKEEQPTNPARAARGRLSGGISETAVDRYRCYDNH